MGNEGGFSPAKSAGITSLNGDVLSVGKCNVPIQSVLYLDSHTVLSFTAHCFNRKKHKIYSKTFSFTSEEEKDCAEKKINDIISQRYDKKRMFAFVNPASGNGKGVKTFHNVIEKHLVRAGLTVDFKVTEKHGQNSLGEIAKTLDLSLYDALLVCGGDSSWRDVINGLWEKEHFRDPYSICWPTFAIMPCGTGNGVARQLYGSFKVQSAVAAVIIGSTFQREFTRVYSNEPGHEFNKLAVVLAAYGFSSDAMAYIAEKGYKGKSRYILGLGKSMLSLCEPFEAKMTIELTDEKDVRVKEGTFRDVILVTENMQFDDSGDFHPMWASMWYIPDCSRRKFCKNVTSVFAKWGRREARAQGESTDGIVKIYAGNVRRLEVTLGENRKHYKNVLNIDGDIFPMRNSFAMEQLQSLIPCIVLSSQHQSIKY